MLSRIACTLIHVIIARLSPPSISAAARVTHRVVLAHGRAHPTSHHRFIPTLLFTGAVVLCALSHAHSRPSGGFSPLVAEKGEHVIISKGNGIIDLPVAWLVPTSPEPSLESEFSLRH